MQRQVDIPKDPEGNPEFPSFTLLLTAYPPRTLKSPELSIGTCNEIDGPVMHGIKSVSAEELADLISACWDIGVASYGLGVMQRLLRDHASKKIVL